jgi:7-dehydrocholesterol reductase
VFRRTVAPALLLLLTPPLVIAVWMINARFDGSIARFLTEIDLARFVRLVPRPTATAAAILAVWIAGQSLLLIALPGRTFLGPPTPSGRQPRYKLNGVAAWMVTHAALLGGWRLDLFSFTTIWRELGALLVTLNLGALLLCLWLYAAGRRRAGDVVVTGHHIFDFFQGVELHPTFRGWSLKQLVNCRISMMGWSALTIALAGHQLETQGHIASSMLVSAALVVAYLFKFFVWESGYFTSLDIAHDRFGYYIAWGVLVWVPSIYTLAAQYLTVHPILLPPAAALGILGLGLAALGTNYAADAQRQRVRATAGRTRVWGRAPALIRAPYRAADGEARESLLLASGFWGLARHFHYVPEILLAVAWTLPAGAAALPWFYVVFLTILLVDRAGRDDRRCHDKYGAAWEEYRGRVPWKILPGIY